MNLGTAVTLGVCSKVRLYHTCAFSQMALVRSLAIHGVETPASSHLARKDTGRRARYPVFYRQFFGLTTTLLGLLTVPSSRDGQLAGFGGVWSGQGRLLQTVRLYRAESTEVTVRNAVRFDVCDGSVSTYNCCGYNCNPFDCRKYAGETC